MRESPYLKDNTSVLEILQGIDYFKSFSAEDLLSLLDLGKIKEYEPGEVIMREGEIDCWIYVLLAGSVDICKNGKRMETLKRKGEIFGEMGVVDGSPRSATIRASKKCVTLGVDGSVLDRKQRQNQIGFNYLVFKLFAEVLAERLRLTTLENTRLKAELEKFKNR